LINAGWANAAFVPSEANAHIITKTVIEPISSGNRVGLAFTVEGDASSSDSALDGVLSPCVEPP
jgi:hypothetical protein